MDFIRNDDAAQIMIAKNATAGSAAVDDKGRVLVVNGGTSAGALKVAEHIYNSVAFGSVNTTYGTLLTVAVNLRGVILYNGMDTLAVFSTDGTNDHLFLPEETGIFIPYGEMGLRVNSNLSVKRVGTASDGAVYASGIY